MCISSYVEVKIEKRTTLVVFVNVFRITLKKSKKNATYILYCRQKSGTKKLPVLLHLLGFLCVPTYDMNKYYVIRNFSYSYTLDLIKLRYCYILLNESNIKRI